MFKDYIFVIIALFIAASLAGCATNFEESSFFKSSEKQVVAKKPESVKILTEKPAAGTFTVLGQVKADQFNMFGIKRQFATIHDILQEEATKLGANAVINLRHQKDLVVAQAIKV